MDHHLHIIKTCHTLSTLVSKFFKNNLLDECIQPQYPTYRTHFQLKSTVYYGSVQREIYLINFNNSVKNHLSQAATFSTVPPTHVPAPCRPHGPLYTTAPHHTPPGHAPPQHASPRPGLVSGLVRLGKISTHLSEIGILSSDKVSAL